MTQALCFFLSIAAQVIQCWIISKQDLNGASASFIVSNWFQTSGGAAYTTSQTVCGQSLMKLDAPNTLYKDYILVDAFFSNIRVEMDLYFVNFKTTTVTVKLNTVTLFTRVFDSTNSIVIDNLCNNPSTDFQYTLSGQVSSSNQNIRIEISYSTVPSPVGYLGIRNLNIYTDGIQTTNGCPLATPTLDKDGVNCVVSCANGQQLSGPNLDKCGTPTPSTSLAQLTYAYTDTNRWLDQSAQPVPRNAQYTTIFTSTLFFLPTNSGTNLLFYNQLSSNAIFKFQFQFLLYILGTWENGSRISFCLQLTNQYEIFTIEKLNGQLITSDRKVTFSTTSIPKGGGTEQALVAFLVFEGFSDAGSTCFFGVKQNLVGSTASYGFGDIVIYRARVSLSTCLTFLIQNYCSVCYPPYYVYQGKCVNTCPSYSVIVDVANKVCKDLNEYEVTTYFPTLSYNAVGTYLIIDYYDYTFTTESINSMFTFSPSTSNNFKNSQYFSFIANVKILGGYQSWGYGSFLKTFSNLSPHYQIRLYLQLYLIDTWTATDTFKVLIDGQIVSTTSKTSSSQIQGKSELDQTIPLVIKVKHSSQSLSLELQCNNSAMDCSKGACGIANMFLLLDQDVNQVCPAQLQYYSFQTQSCQTCAGTCTTGCILSSTTCYQKCSYQCKTCSTISVCTSCDINLNRIVGTPTTTCVCQQGYYQVVNVSACQQCHYSCLSCTQYGSNQCLSCPNNATSHRSQAGSQCNCDPGFTDVANMQVCESAVTCDYSCLTCSGPANNQCLTCPANATSHRTKSGNTCPCDANYTDVTNQVNCTYTCHYSCLTCSGPLISQCSTCPANSTSHRTQSGNTCPCDANYTDVTSQANCTYTCHYSCLTCSGPLISQCSTCPANATSHRTQSGNTCPCDANYTDVANQANCIQNCHYSCLQCTGLLASQCSNCPSYAITFRVEVGTSCPCDTNYTEVPNQQICNYTCDYSCLTCSGPYNNQCSTCPANATSHRTKSGNTCPCDANYTDVTNQVNCTYTCHYTCLTCSGPLISQCSTCPANSTSHRTQSGNTCPCDANYTDVTSQANCTYTCHYSCLTCSGPLISQCSTCPANATSHRTQSGNTCPCDANYTDVANQANCTYTCHYTCLTCLGPLISQCSTCPANATSHRTQSGNACPCDANYVDVVNQQICTYTCDYRCLTCSGPLQNECLTCPANVTSHRSQVTTTCPCDINYMDVATQQVCTYTCHYSCLTCSGPLISQCSTCPANGISHRIQSGSTCPCDANYIDVDNVQNCGFNCNFICGTCTGPQPNQCSSCISNSTSHRTQSGATCPCDSGYTDNGSLPNCIMICHHSCNTCTGLTDNDCIDCVGNSISHRTAQGSTCPCDADYFDVTNQSTCGYNCHVSCDTCTGPLINQCATCATNSVSHRTLNGTSCDCDFGYFDTFSILANCAFNCHYSCDTCTGPLDTQCSACPPNVNSFRTQSGNSCPCDPNYFDVAGQQNCGFNCEYTCDTCSGPLSNQCLTCSANAISHRTQSSNTCPCDANYFEIPAQQICGFTCDYTCDTCFGPYSNQCSTCSTNLTYHRILTGNECLCDTLYFPVANQMQCDYICHYSCATCNGPHDNQCLTCPANGTSHRTQSGNQCPCDTNYFNVINQSICGYLCHYSCDTCTGPEFNQCSTCPTFTLAFRLQVGNTCICDTDYHEGFNQQICLSNCHYSCLTCSTLDYNECLTCPINSINHRTLIGTSCICDNQYYNVEGIKSCQPICHFTCKKCFGLLADQCSECNQTILSHRYLAQNKCLCNVGFRDVGIEVCKPIYCLAQCLTCIDDLSCQSCDPNKHRILHNQLCICMDQYYEHQNECLPCLPQCNTCLNNTSCLTCKTGLFRNFVANQCLCQQDYYDVLDSIKCESCIENNAWFNKQCTKVDCDDGVFTYGEQCDDNNDSARDGCVNCMIQPGYYCTNLPLEKSKCIRCGTNCEECENDGTCKVCSSGYYANALRKCVQCQSNCKKCDGEQCLQCTIVPTNLPNKLISNCPLCEYFNGYYTMHSTTINNESTYVCVPKCGDLITIIEFDEECDDGNTNDNDGCSSLCKVEFGYKCQLNSCSQLQFPEPILTAITPSNNYTDSRVFQLNFTELIVKPIDLLPTLNITIMNYNKEQYNITLTEYSSGPDDQCNYSVIINVALNGTVSSKTLFVQFKRQELITTKDGQSIQLTQAKSKVYDYYNVDNEIKIVTQQVKSFNEIMLYILLVLVSIGVLFGGLDTFWNLMDVVQLLSYTNLIDTRYPYNLNEFLNLFEFGQLRFMNNLLQVQSTISLSISDTEFEESKPTGILEGQVESTMFIYNMAGVLTSFIIIAGLYITSHIVIKLIHTIEDFIIIRNQYHLSVKPLSKVIKIKNYVKQYASSFKNQFFYSVLIRTHMSLAYDMTFAIFLTLTNFEVGSDIHLITNFSNITALITAIVYLSLGTLYIMKSNIISGQLKSLQYENKFGSALFDGLDTKRMKRSAYYNIFLVFKRFFYIMSLITLISTPQIQTLTMAILGSIHVFILINTTPLESNSEFYKQLQCELLLLFMHLEILVLTLDDAMIILSEDNRINIGWLAVGQITLIIVIQLLIDIYQQYLFLYRKIILQIIQKCKPKKNVAAATMSEIQI